MRRSRKFGAEMGFLSNAPQGFSSAVAALNSLPQGVLAEMCQDVLAFLQYRAGFIDVSNHDLTLSGLNLDPKPSAQACMNALTFIFRSAAREGVGVEALVQELQSSMAWAEGSIAVLKHVWKEQGPSLSSLPASTLSIGELLTMDWKLGVAMSASSCRSLNCPYVSVQLTVASIPGQPRTHTLDMTVPEFQNFARQLKEMASALETAT